VFKGPTHSSFSNTAPVKFDGYHSAPPAEQRQNQNWHSVRARDAFGTYPVPTEVSRAALLRLNESSVPTNRNYDPNSRSTTPSYSIYAANNMFIYEPSLSSKSDIYSNTEYDGASTPDLTPSSAFSPAMSTDSVAVLRSPTPTESALDSRSSTPTLTLNTLPMLSHTPAVFKEVFRSQTPHATSAHPGNSSLSRASSTRPPTVFGSREESVVRAASPPVQGRSTTPVRSSSTSSGSENQNAYQFVEPHSTLPLTGNSGQSYAPSIVSESDDGEDHRLARANAEYNAASSAYYQQSSAVFRELRTIDQAPGSTVNASAAAPRQIYSNLPLRTSPEQHHSTPNIYGRASDDPNQGNTFSNFSQGGSDSRVHPRPPYHRGESQPEDQVSGQSEFLPPLPHIDQEPVATTRSPPARRQAEYGTPSQIPEVWNEGHLSRYIPASRTMARAGDGSSRSSESTSDSNAIPRELDRRQDRALPIPPPPPSQPPNLPRERTTSLSQQPGPHHASQSIPTSSTSRDARPVASPPDSRRDSSASFPHSQPPYPISQSFLNAPREANGVSPPFDQAEERAGETLKRSPQGQRPMPSSSYYTRDIGVTQDQSTLPSTRLSSSILFSDRAPPALSSSPDQMSDIDIRREASFAGASRNHNDLRYQSPVAVHSSNPSADRSPPISKPFPQQVPDNTVRRELPTPTTIPIHHDSRSTNHLNDPKLPSPVTASLPPHTRSQQTYLSDSVHPRGQPIPSATQYISANRGGSVNVASGTTGNYLPSSATMRHSSTPFTSPTTNISDPNRAPSQPLGSFNSGKRDQPESGDPSQYYDSARNHANRETPFAGGRPRGESTSPLNQPAFRSSRNIGPPEEPSFSFSDSSREPGNRMNPTVNVQETPRSHAPFTVPSKPAPEPHRRHSDGDRFVNSDYLLRNAPPYASSDPTGTTTGQNVGISRTSPTNSVPLEPHRRFSDGDQSHPRVRGSAPCRTVRWNENLVCPSPIWPSQRRKGWFNRCG
jgi:hypothetical protein